MTIEPRSVTFPPLRLRSPFTTSEPAPVNVPPLRSRLPVTVSVLPEPTVSVRPPVTIKLLTVTSADVIDASFDEIVTPVLEGGTAPFPQFEMVCQSVLIMPVQTVPLQRAK